MTTQMYELHDIIKGLGFKRVGCETGCDTQLKFWFEKQLEWEEFDTSGIYVRLSQTSKFYHSVISIEAEIWGRRGTEHSSIQIKELGENSVRQLLSVVEERLLKIWTFLILLGD